MAEVLAELIVDINGRIDRLDRNMRLAEGRAKKASGRMGETFKKMFAGLGLAIIMKKAFDFTIVLKNAARDGEEIRSKFDTVFSSMVEGANKTADAFSKEFKLAGATTRDLLGATGDLLVGFGFTEQSALDMSEQVNRLAQDLASFTNFSGGAKGASDALTKAILGETESAKSLGIVIRQDTKEFKDQVQELMVMRGVTMQQAKSIAILEEAYKQSGKAVGDFERTQDSLANRERILDEQLKDLHETLGKELVPIFTDLVQTMQNATQGFSDFNQGLKDFTGLGDIEKGVGVIQNLFNAISLAMGKGGFVLDEYKKKLVAADDKAKDLEKTWKDIGNTLGFARDLTSQLAIHMRNMGDGAEDLGRTVKVVRDEIAVKQKLIDEGNISVARGQELAAEILALNQELTGEVEKQVEASRILADNYEKIKESLAFGATGGGVTATASGRDMIGGFPTAPVIDMTGMETPAEIVAEYFKSMEESTSNIDQKFISILNAGASLSNILNIGAHTFIGILLSGLNTANSIANSIFGIISAFTGGGAGGILGWLFPKKAMGGSMLNGREIASYAGGVSGIVPQGFPNDSFPMLVQSGERVDITPTHKVGGTETALKNLGTGINNLIEGMMSSSGQSGEAQNINVFLEGDLIATINEKKRNQLKRSGVNLEQL